ncbi:hypothetical protein ERHA55_39200 [Erwinia rhapontici]|nr:hypothetical protein ERHA55_39200 [Erwinia rhapontici]
MADALRTAIGIDLVEFIPIEIASLGHSGSHISQLIHFLVISSAIILSSH